MGCCFFDEHVLDADCRYGMKALSSQRRRSRCRVDPYQLELHRVVVDAVDLDEVRLSAQCSCLQLLSNPHAM
jgi:hypothetical protein